MCLQCVCQTLEMKFGLNKRQEFTQHHNAKRHLGQWEDWLFCVLLAMCKYNIWLNVCICWSTGRHFKHSVGMLICTVLYLVVNEIYNYSSPHLGSVSVVSSSPSVAWVSWPVPGTHHLHARPEMVGTTWHDTQIIYFVKVENHVVNFFFKANKVIWKLCFYPL